MFGNVLTVPIQDCGLRRTAKSSYGRVNDPSSVDEMVPTNGRPASAYIEPNFKGPCQHNAVY